MPDAAQVARNFNRAAPHYERTASLQRDMGTHLLELVTPLVPADCRAILDLGCGSGTMAHALRARFGRSSILGVDIAGDMLALARAATAGDADMHFLEAEAAHLAARAPAENQFDLLFTNAAVQWFNVPVLVMRAFRHWLRPGGVMAIATFGPDTFQELRTAFAVAEARLGRPQQPHVLPFTAVAAWQAGLSRGRPRGRLTIVEQRIVQRYPALPDVRRWIKHCGASLPPSAPSRYPGRLLPRELARAYAELAGATPGLPVTFHLIYLIWQRAARAPVRGLRCSEKCG